MLPVIIFGVPEAITSISSSINFSACVFRTRQEFFLRFSFNFSFICIITALIHITTKRMVAHPTVIYVAFAHAQKANHVTLLTDSLTLLYHGVFHIREIGTITGLDYTADWSGTDISVQRSQILSPWENRWEEFYQFFLFYYFSYPTCWKVLLCQNEHFGFSRLHLFFFQLHHLTFYRLLDWLNTIPHLCMIIFLFSFPLP